VAVERPCAFIRGEERSTHRRIGSSATSAVLGGRSLTADPDRGTDERPSRANAPSVWAATGCSSWKAARVHVLGTLVPIPRRAAEAGAACPRGQRPRRRVRRLVVAATPTRRRVPPRAPGVVTEACQTAWDGCKRCVRPLDRTNLERSAPLFELSHAHRSWMSSATSEDPTRPRDDVIEVRGCRRRPR
jgi:hypothetical protein